MATKKKTKAELVLRRIQKAGKRGMTYSQIQRYVCGLSGKDWEEREPVMVGYRHPATGITYDRSEGRAKPWETFRMLEPVYKPGPRRRHRGFWSTNLTGGAYYGPGLLGRFCEKGVDGRWRLAAPIRAPFTRGLSRVKGKRMALIMKVAAEKGVAVSPKANVVQAQAALDV